MKVKSPLISLVLATKNALPHLKKAIEAIKYQSYQNIELIVQDGASTDGTLEYLESLTSLPSINIDSRIDSGISQAFSRGLRRIQGELFCFVSADETLHKNSLKTAIDWYQKFPDAAAIFGSVELVYPTKKTVFIPESFDFYKLLCCEMVPPIAATVFNRKVIGDDVYYDDTLKTCPDYDFWLRLGARFSRKEIINQRQVLTTALADERSMSFRAEAADQLCKDKCLILNRFLDKRPEFRSYKNLGMEGIYRWGAISAYNADPSSLLPRELSNEAEKWSKKEYPYPLKNSIEKSFSQIQALNNDSFKKGILYNTLIYGFNKIFFKNKLKTYNPWKNLFEFSLGKYELSSYRYWIKISILIKSGAISILYKNGPTVVKQKIFYQQHQKIETVYPISDFKIDNIIFRKGGTGDTFFKILDLAIIKS